MAIFDCVDRSKPSKLSGAQGASMHAGKSRPPPNLLVGTGFQRCDPLDEFPSTNLRQAAKVGRSIRIACQIRSNQQRRSGAQVREGMITFAWHGFHCLRVVPLHPE